MPVRARVKALACAGAVFALCPATWVSPAFAQSDWFRPPADVGSSRAAPQQQQTRPRQQAPARQQQQQQVQPQAQRQQWQPLFPLFEIFRGGERPPRYAAPPEPQTVPGGIDPRPRRATAPQIEAPAEPRGTVYSSIEAARKGTEKQLTDVVLVLGDEFAAPLAQGLADAFAADRAGVAVIGKGESGSGFAPGAGFDWVTAGPQLATADEATAIVAFAGSNDLHPITDAAGKAELFDERWREIYGRRFDDFLTGLKAHGRPVVIVGLAPVDDNKASERNSKLNELLKERTERAGLIFVDVWDGFVDENGKFMMSGPAVDGQRRRLRTSDGAGFTRAGGRKLAFFVDRALGKLLHDGQSGAPAAAAGNTGPATPAGGPPAIIQLTGGAGIGARTLAGGKPGETLKSGSTENAAARVLVSGEAAPHVAGRADDFRWQPPGSHPAQSAGTGAASTAPTESGAAAAVPAAGTGTTP